MRISDWSSDVCSSDLPATRQIHLPLAQADPRPQGARGADRLLAGSVADQGRDSRTLSVERLFRRQLLWVACRLAPLFQPPARKTRPRAGGAACGMGQGALRSEERRLGKEGVKTFRSRWSP